MDNNTKKFDIAEEIDNFRRINGITLNQISTRSGISVTNIGRVLNDGDDLFMSVLVRIVSTMWDKNIANSIFKTRAQKCILQSLIVDENDETDRDICSTTDYAALIILLSDYFKFGNEHDAEDNLKDIYRALEGEIAVIYSGNGKRGYDKDSYFGNYIDYHSKIEHKNNNNQYYKDTEEYIVNKAVLDIHLKSYFEKNFFEPTFLSDTDPMFTIPVNRYREYMEAGETMVWSDVRNLLKQYRIDNGKDGRSIAIKDLNTGAIIHRLETMKNYSYKCNDIMAVDDELEMGGAFFSLCYNATKNSLLLGKICTMMSDEKKSFQKIEDQEKFERGIHSFFSMLRFLERNKDVNNSPYKVLNVLRQVCFYKDVSWHKNWLDQAVNEFPEYFPENPLKYYQKLPE